MRKAFQRGKMDDCEGCDNAKFEGSKDDRCSECDCEEAVEAPLNPVDAQEEISEEGDDGDFTVVRRKKGKSWFDEAKSSTAAPDKESWKPDRFKSVKESDVWNSYKPRSDSPHRPRSPPPASSQDRLITTPPDYSPRPP